ncbi:complement C1q-like protein 4 [Perca fluviatilis]|uniref:complement C1q-like protein 4 n=1 Tax=Perca fluviatilis TaxID=8168 RepID=UPI0019649ADE|nr:complement C1q-like protein 4 [Perca fluviatilis]
MKIFVSFTLWLLLGTISANESVDCQQTFPQDIYAALREMTASLVQLKADVTTLQREFLQTQEQGAQQKTEVDKLKQQQLVRQVAFSASLHAGAGKLKLGPFSTDTLLIYKHVFTNIGNAYNSNTGAFTAPVRGAYNFEWTINAEGDGSRGSGAWLVKNSEKVVVAYEEQPTTGYMSSSKGITLLLEVGDVVFVRLWAGSLVHDSESHPTTFSGHLLFPM